MRAITFSRTQLAAMIVQMCEVISGGQPIGKEDRLPINGAAAKALAAGHRVNRIAMLNRVLFMAVSHFTAAQRHSLLMSAAI